MVLILSIQIELQNSNNCRILNGRTFLPLHPDTVVHRARVPPNYLLFPSPPTSTPPPSCPGQCTLFPNYVVLAPYSKFVPMFPVSIMPRNSWLTMQMLFLCEVTSSPYILSEESHARPSYRGSLQLLIVSTVQSLNHIRGTDSPLLYIYEYDIAGIGLKNSMKEGVSVLFPPEFLHLVLWDLEQDSLTPPHFRNLCPSFLINKIKLFDYMVREDDFQGCLQLEQAMALLMRERSPHLYTSSSSAKLSSFWIKCSNTLRE